MTFSIPKQKNFWKWEIIKEWKYSLQKDHPSCKCCYDCRLIICCVSAKWNRESWLLLTEPSDTLSIFITPCVIAKFAFHQINNVKKLARLIFSSVFEVDVRLYSIIWSLKSLLKVRHILVLQSRVAAASQYQ